MFPAQFLLRLFFGIPIVIDLFHFITSYCIYIRELLDLGEAKIIVLQNEGIRLSSRTQAFCNSLNMAFLSFLILYLKRPL